MCRRVVLANGASLIVPETIAMLDAVDDLKLTETAVQFLRKYETLGNNEPSLSSALEPRIETPNFSVQSFSIDSHM